MPDDTKYDRHHPAGQKALRELADKIRDDVVDNVAVWGKVYDDPDVRILIGDLIFARLLSDLDGRPLQAIAHEIVIDLKRDILANRAARGIISSLLQNDKEMAYDILNDWVDIVVRHLTGASFDHAIPFEDLRRPIVRHKRYAVAATGETGIHTGRMRYHVRCLECSELLHEATTGLESRMAEHDRVECRPRPWDKALETALRGLDQAAAGIRDAVQHAQAARAAKRGE